jgi:glycosyltransferase involved in cell wall biosynthesis
MQSILFIGCLDVIYMNDLVSIIVPVYNTAYYLPKCIKSMLNQTYHNIEIILVDDGSTDKSATICDKYAKRDKRIRVIHKKNGGVSSARNTGIENATGRYIMFVDSDDWLPLNAVESLHKAILFNDGDFCTGRVKFIAAFHHSIHGNSSNSFVDIHDKNKLYSVFQEI